MQAIAIESSIFLDISISKILSLLQDDKML
jgi:hypothetical protein